MLRLFEGINLIGCYVWYFGILNNDESDQKIRLLSDSMIHRGPDDKKFNKSKWAIGMRRLLL